MSLETKLKLGKLLSITNIDPEKTVDLFSFEIVGTLTFLFTNKFRSWVNFLLQITRSETFFAPFNCIVFNLNRSIHI
ncbi:hypothetical protein LEP1GSC073_3807 [Leptospira noguchii str. Cascata]|nr:hypothetical protein LEP1GSC073_3807 [Leptospira noguchii str. Cascata]